MTLALLELLAPAWLWGLVGIALPVAAHWLSRRDGRRVVIPTVRFIRQAQSARGRRLRPRQWTLLALRAALVAAVALAFAQPAWRSRRALGALEPAGVDLVLIVDASASMTRAVDGRSPFDDAVAQAMATLEGLDPARDRAAVVLAGLRPRSTLPRLSANFSALRNALAQSRPTLERADLSAALQLAAAFTGASDGTEPDALRPRRIHIFTDGQATQWRGVTLPAALRSVHQVAVHRVPFRSEGLRSVQANLALANPVLTPAEPLAGMPATLTVDVSNFGPLSRSPLVTLDPLVLDDGSSPSPRLDGASRVVAIPPGATVAATFRIVVPEAGFTWARIALRDEGGFAPDDAIDLAVFVRAGMRVGLLTRADPRDHASAAYFFRAALAPDAAGAVEIVALDPDASPPDPPATDPGARDALIVVEAGSLSPAWLDHLRQRLTGVGASADPADGTAPAIIASPPGGVWWIVDSIESARSLAAFADLDPALPLTPLRPDLATAGTPLPPARFAAADFASDALAVFDGPLGHVLLSQTITPVVQCAATPRARVLLRAADSEPLAASIGAPSGGKLLVLNGSLAPEHGPLVHQPLFPVLVHEWTRFVQPDRCAGRRATCAVGEPISAPILATSGESAPQRLRILPEGHPAMPAADPAGGFVVRGSPRTTPGLVRWREEGGQRVVAATTITLDPLESDLRPASEDAWTAIESGPTDPKPGDDGGSHPMRASSEAPVATPLWPACIAFALFLVSVESLLLALLRGHRSSMSSVAGHSALVETRWEVER